MTEVGFSKSANESSDKRSGPPKDWPHGVYTKGDFGSVVVVGPHGVIYILGDNGGTWDTDDDFALSDYCRISDDYRIASITFAGAMNYPDGKPEGGAA